MPAHYPVPIQEDIRDLLNGLLGRAVAADRIKPQSADDEDPSDRGAIAEYVTDEGETGALCIMDDRFVVRAGAALVMVPTNAAEDDLKRGELDNYLPNVQEVLNVMTRLLNSPHTPHLRLKTVHRLPGELPEGVVSLREKPEFRRDFAVFMEGYGDSRFSLLVN
jgi:hypothetical protein